MIHVRNILNRGLPKTGQTIIYATGDDGTYQAGWWPKRLFTGNRTRFIDNGTVIVDRATGLMWPKNMSGVGGNNGNSGIWLGVIGWANSLTFAGYSDWRCPNVTELESLVNYEADYPALYDCFINCPAGDHWSSTLLITNTAYAWYIVLRTAGEKGVDFTTNTKKMLAVRGGV